MLDQIVSKTWDIVSLYGRTGANSIILVLEPLEKAIVGTFS
jgi:hypothetical protein